MQRTFQKVLDTIVAQAIEWADQFVELLPRLIVAILIVLFFALLAKMTKRAIGILLERMTDNASLVRLSKTVTYISVLTIGLFIALSVLKLEKTVTSLLAGVGVIGLALGFAFQETAANFMSGVFLAIKRPYSIGQVIKVGDAFGVVKSMDLRTTVIESWNGQDIIIPNKDLFQGRITNYSANDRRRIDLVVGVSYGDDLKKAQKVTKEALEKMTYLHPDHEVEVFFTEFGSSSINMECHIWIPYDVETPFYQARDEAVICIKQAFDENDITIPFPIRTLDFGIKGGRNLRTMLND